MTGTGQIPHAIANFYNRTLLERALPELLHDKFGQVRDIPKNNSDTIKFRKYGALALNTTPLVEGITPQGKQLSVTDITATVSWYGDYVTLTDQLLLTTFDPVLTETAEVLGEQAGQSMDAVIRDVLVAGTNVRYADGVANRASVASSNKMDADECKIAIRTMKNNNAKKISRMVNPQTGYATTPVNSAYVVIVHPNTSYDLKGISGWKPIETYASAPGFQKLPAEIGAYDELRFCESTQAKVFTGAGASSIDVYASLVFGQNAYGISRISGEAMRNIIKPVGSAGTADPLDQRSTSGWKSTLVAVILQQLFMLRIEHAVS